MEKKPFLSVPLQSPISPHLFERRACNSGLLICGIDEAGRGPLAGPVVAAAVILKPGKKHPLLRDSKEMTPAERDQAYDWLARHSWSGVGVISHRIIERVGIYRATLLAMERAYHQLIAAHARLPATVLVDAMPLRLEDCFPAPLPETITDPWSADPLLYPWHKIIHFPHSERLSRSIAAASIIAKVTRDRIMEHAAQLYPGYGFEQHKGYGTAGHQKAHLAKGLCLIHRPQFIKQRAPDTPLPIPFGEDKTDLPSSSTCTRRHFANIEKHATIGTGSRNKSK